MVDKNVMMGLGKQNADQRGVSRGLAWIRPEMMQQVLSSVEKKAAHFPNQMLKLFPESSTEDTMASSYGLFSNQVTDNRSVSGSEKQSTAQLTIFYNGAVKAYHVSADEAQAVMKLANSNSSEGATMKPSHSEHQHSKKLTAGLPMTRNLSLQRFLQKRKDRLGNPCPYSCTDCKTSAKASAEEGEEEYPQISLSLSFPSQRSG